jgi:hypothetical protein
MDRSFWSLHDDLTTFALLGFPTFLALATLGAAVALVVRNYDPDPAMAWVGWMVLVPVSAITIVTFLPLPCSVFAWSRAQGTTKTAGQCLTACARRSGRLLPIIAWLVFSYCWWSMLFWIPLLVLWPRTCLAPMVALFEDQRRVFRRSRRLMREDHAIFVLAGLYLLLMLVLGSVIFLPRMILLTEMFRTPWAAALEESIWAFELVSGVLLLTGVAISWCIALTLFYHDLRHHREGESLRNRVEELYSRYVVTGEPA